MVREVTGAYADYLTDRFGRQATASSSLRTPVRLETIPLGVDIDRFRPANPAERAAARHSLGVDDDEVAILYVGRLSHHAKAHPFPIFRGASEAALATGRRVHLILAGWAAHPAVHDAFKDGARDVCPQRADVARRRPGSGGASLRLARGRPLRLAVGQHPGDLRPGRRRGDGQRPARRRLRLGRLPRPGRPRSDRLPGPDRDGRRRDDDRHRAALDRRTGLRPLPGRVQPGDGRRRPRDGRRTRAAGGRSGAAAAHGRSRPPPGDREHFAWSKVIRSYEELWRDQEAERAARARAFEAGVRHGVVRPARPRIRRRNRRSPATRPGGSTAPTGLLPVAGSGDRVGRLARNAAHPPRRRPPSPRPGASSLGAGAGALLGRRPRPILVSTRRRARPGPGDVLPGCSSTTCSAPSSTTPGGKATLDEENSA